MSEECQELEKQFSIFFVEWPPQKKKKHILVGFSALITSSSRDVSEW